MCFCEPIMSRIKKKVGKMLNMLLLIREMYYYAPPLKKGAYCFATVRRLVGRYVGRSV